MYLITKEKKSKYLFILQYLLKGKQFTCLRLVFLIIQLTVLQASALIKDICGNLSIAAKSVENIDYTVVLRGDSTLRGHFPEARMKALECRIIILSTPS
jgi:hypothetical protein